MPYDEPLSLAECPKCGERVLRMKVGGIETKANLLPITNPVGDTGRVYRVLFAEGGRPKTFRPATPAELVAFVTSPVSDKPYLTREHPCAAVSRPLTPSPASGTGGPGKAPQAGVQSLRAEPGGIGAPRLSLAGRTTPSPDRSTEPSGARSADRPRSDRSPGKGSVRPSDGIAGRPRCSACGEPCADGTYASVALGDLVLWAEHVDRCRPTSDVDHCPA